MKKVDPKRQKLSWTSPFKIHIASSKDEAKRDMRCRSDGWEVYIDGSDINRGI